MRVLVTGGAGFIGSQIVQALLVRGYQVTVVDDLSAGRRENVPAGAEFKHMSIFDLAFAGECEGAAVVVHAAAQTSVSASVADPYGDAHTNIEGTARVARMAVLGGAKRVVYLSSAAVYGAPIHLPIGEEHPVNPLSPYGLSKLTGEYYVRMLCAAGNVGWVVARLANVYGPRQRVDGEAGVVAKWAAALAAGEPLELHGDGTQTRDFVYVADVAEAVAQAVAAPQSRNLLVNIGSGRELSLLELLAELEAAYSRQASPVAGPPRPGDIARSCLSTDRARRELGWVARTPLPDGLRATVNWYGREPVTV